MVVHFMDQIVLDMVPIIGLHGAMIPLMVMVHSSIRPDGLESSDWEQDGERVWDAMRALDYLISLPFVDSKNVVVTGLSMGVRLQQLLEHSIPAFLLW
jgi:hypothetical protein